MSEKKTTWLNYLHLFFFILLFGSFAYSLYVDDLFITLIFFAAELAIDYAIKIIVLLTAKKPVESPEDKEPVKLPFFKNLIKKFTLFVKKNKIRIVGLTFGISMFLGLVASQFEEIIGLFFIPILLIEVGVTIYLNKKWNLDELAKPHPNARYERYGWVDQFRGLVVVLLIISTVTWDFSPDFGDGLPQIGPTWLNHGWKFAEYAGWADMITIIDIGQQILMFILGFVGALAYYRHKAKEGKMGATLHIIRRFVGLMGLVVLLEGVFSEDMMHFTNWVGKEADFGKANLVSIFWTGTFCNLAWGSLISLLLVVMLEKKADTRAIVAIVIMVAHSVMFEVPLIQDFVFYRPEFPLSKFFEVPWNTINHVAIAILGTCTYDWYEWLKTEKNPEIGWKKRILPFATISFILMYLLNFVQPAEHHDATTALTFLAIGTSQFILFIFYAFEKAKFKIPGLTEFGRNILFMFLFTGLRGGYVGQFTHEQYAADPWLALSVVGIALILVNYFSAWVLNKFRVYIKF